jgi:hypothetical protein
LGCLEGSKWWLGNRLRGLFLRVVGDVIADG